MQKPVRPIYRNVVLLAIQLETTDNREKVDQDSTWFVLFLCVGKVAYVPQQAWILNASIRKNILFTKPFKNKKYEEILKARPARWATT